MWNEKLPQWDNVGSEPPEQKKTTGWEVDEAPPAGWLNWLQNRAYKCILEIRNAFDAFATALSGKASQDDLNAVVQAQTSHQADNTKHITSTERSVWNGKIDKSLASAANDFLVASGAGAWVKKTLAEVKTLLGLKSAAYTESSTYATSAQGTLATNAMPKAGGTWSGESNHADQLVTRAYLKDYAEVIGTTPATSGTVSFNLETGNTFNITPTGAITVAISNPPVSGRVGSFTLRINNGATVYAKTFPASFKWDKGVVPDMSTANKAIVITGFTIDGGLTWLVSEWGTEF